MLFFGHCCLAQTLENYIPRDVPVVVCFQPKILNQKVDLEKLRQMPVFAGFIREIADNMTHAEENPFFDVLKNPNDYGIDLLSSSYFFLNQAEENTYNFIFELSDATKFTHLIEKNSHKELLKTPLKGGYQMSVDEGISILWNDKIVLLSTRVHHEHDEYKEDTTDIEHNQSIASQTQHILTKKGTESLMNNSRYQAAHKGSAEVHLWLDYDFVMKTRMAEAQMLAQIPGMESMYNLMMDFYKDTYVSIQLAFNNGEISLISDTYLNPQLSALSKGIVDAQINKKFAKYIPQEDLIAYYAFSINVEKTIKGIKGLAVPVLEQIPEYGNLANNVLDVLDIAIDEQAIYQLFKGDLLFALTGIQELEHTVTSYEYDDDFNAIEKQTMVKEPLPEVIMMLSYGNESDLMKLIRLGEKAGVLSKKDHYFKLIIPNFPTDMFLVLHKGILFISNNKNFVQNKLNKGYKKSDRLNKKHCRQLQENSQVFFWDFKNTINAVYAMKIPMIGEVETVFNIVKENIDHFQVVSDKIQDNTAQTKIQVILTNDDMNALKQSFIILNDFYEWKKGNKDM